MKELVKTILYKPLYNILILLVFLMPGHNVGLAIILLTILIRFALVPSTNKSYQAQKEIKMIQPLLEEIKEKYSKEEQAQKTMELYKEHNVNPLGSCLPMLIQLPIIFILYRVFQDGLNASRFDLLYSFIPRPEVMNTMFLGIDLAKPEKFILPTIVGLLQMAQMWQLQNYTGMNTKKVGENGKPDMATMMTKQMMYLTPVMTFFIAYRLPAALPLYWGATTLFTIVQQWWFFEKKGVKNIYTELEIGKGEKKDEKAKYLPKAKEEPKEEIKAEPKKTKKIDDRKFKSKSKDVVVTVRRKK